MESLNVKKNKIVNSKGKEVILKGVNINSPGILKYEEDHDFLNDIKEIKKLRANAVRVPISPAYFQSKKDYCEEILSPIVALCKNLGLYCLLDWHAHGDPEKNITRKSSRFPDIDGYLVFDANKDHAQEALETLAKKYGRERHVLFETFCSPLDLSWDSWKIISEEIVKSIRKFSSSIICVNGVKFREDKEGKKLNGEVDYTKNKDVMWYQDMTIILQNPLNEENIVYGAAIYPGTPERDKESIIKLKRKFPVIINECGYGNNSSDAYLSGTKENYTTPLKKILEKNHLSFFAWCYHPVRKPTILNSWDPDDLTEWGNFLKKELLN